MSTITITTNERNYLIDNMTNLLHTYDYNPTEEALNTIIDEWAEQKSDLIEAFKRHPNYLEGKFMIAFDQDYTREVDYGVASDFWRWTHSSRGPMFSLYNNLPDDIEVRRDANHCLPSRTYEVISLLLHNYNRTIDEDEARNINEEFPHIRARAGQRRTRIVNKIFTYLRYNQHEEYNRKFAEYADSITPMTIRRHTILSLNPLDYLTMSFGNSWSSCHTIDKKNIRHMDSGYHGRFSSGTMSYMLDCSSMVFYTVDASYDGTEYWNEPKVNRQMFHWEYNKLIQGRLYPQSNDEGANDLYESYRNIIQEIISQIYDFPNLWDMKKGNEEIGGYVVSNGTNYKDYECYDTCTISFVRNCSMSDPVHIGEMPICIRCGERHDVEEWIDCCKAHEGQRKCARCGCWHDECNVEMIDEAWYCENCIYRCDVCHELHVWGSETSVEDYGHVCPNCIKDTTKFFKCADCGRIHHINSMREIKKYNRQICYYCCSRHYTQCAICGEYEYDYSIKHFNGGARVCPECYHIFQIGKEKCAEMEANN